MKRTYNKNKSTISSEEFEYRLKTCIQWCKLPDVREKNIRGTFRRLYEISDITEKLTSLNFIKDIKFTQWTKDLHLIRLRSLKEGLVSIKMLLPVRI